MTLGEFTQSYVKPKNHCVYVIVYDNAGCVIISGMDLKVKEWTPSVVHRYSDIRLISLSGLRNKSG